MPIRPPSAHKLSHRGAPPAIADPEVERYLRQVQRLLRLRAAGWDDVRRELLAHIDEAVEADVWNGMSRHAALVRALQDLGEPAELAAALHEAHRRPRWIMQGTIAAASVGCVVLAYGLLGLPGQPRTDLQDGRPPAAGAAAHGTDERDSANRAMERALARRLAELGIEDAPLDGAIEYLASQLQGNVHVRWNRLADCGIERSAPISLRLRDVTLECGLRLLMGEFGECALGYYIEDGVLIITTKEDVYVRLVTRVYDVRDLLQCAGADAAEAGEPSDSEVHAPHRPQTAQEKLEHLIVQTVEPESWMENGGAGTLVFYGDTLAVRAAGPVHRVLADVLEQLRDALGAAH